MAFTVKSNDGKRWKKYAHCFELESERIFVIFHLTKQKFAVVGDPISVPRGQSRGQGAKIFLGVKHLGVGGQLKIFKLCYCNKTYCGLSQKTHIINH